MMPFTRRAFSSLAAVAAMAVVFGVEGAKAQASGDGPLEVVATTGMIADAAARVGGDLVEVQALMGPGVDPHAYRQTRSDIVAMTRADLVLWHGLYLEAQLEDFMQDLARNRPVVAVAESVPQDLLLGHDDYPDKFDPHVWITPSLWTHVVAGVRDALIDVRPDDADIFNANATAYLAEIDRLAAYQSGVLSSVPPEARVLLTAHDAFNYFGDRYGFEVGGLQGISTETEASTADVQELASFIAEQEIPAIFVESSVPQRNVEAVQAAVRSQGHEVVIGGELFSDAMGDDGTFEGTYIGMVTHNIDTIVSALLGK